MRLEQAGGRGGQPPGCRLYELTRLGGQQANGVSRVPGEGANDHLSEVGEFGFRSNVPNCRDCFWRMPSKTRRSGPIADGDPSDAQGTRLGARLDVLEPTRAADSF